MQRQLRLGDILDDYCPRERRLTNHAIVAMVGSDVKQTRCTTCDAEHEYKHAKVPRPRRKDAPAALYAPGAAVPKRHEPAGSPPDLLSPASDESNREAVSAEHPPGGAEPEVAVSVMGGEGGGPDGLDHQGEETGERDDEREHGPVHRPLIRASLPRPEGQPPPTRPAPEFTIRQPGGRQNRFRPRHQRGADRMFGNRPGGQMTGGPHRGGGQRQNIGRPPGMPRPGKRHGPGHKRSK